MSEARRLVYLVLAEHADRESAAERRPEMHQEFKRIAEAFHQAYAAMVETAVALEREAGADTGHGVQGAAPVAADLPEPEDAQSRADVPTGINLRPPAQAVERDPSLDEATLWGK
jgi:hypothetical protein